jgi:hypothetical protein
VYHMSYVRQDTAPQQPAAEPAATGIGVASSPVAAAGGTAATDVGPAAAAAEAIPVITFLYKLAEGAADESFGLNVAQVCVAGCRAWAGAGANVLGVDTGRRREFALAVKPGQAAVVAGSALL